MTVRIATGFILSLLAFASFADSTKDIIESFDSDHLNLFSSLTYMEGKEGAIRTAEVQGPFELVYNNDAFPENISNIPADLANAWSVFKKGSPLALDAKTPIGYNAYLPLSVFSKAREVKAIIVDVYGGGTKGSAASAGHSFFSRPNVPNDVEKYLLFHDIAVIRLNLIDLLTDGYQQQIPEAIYQRIHQSINKFLEQIKTHPEKLHPDLKHLAHKKTFFMGASFGGRAATWHAEKFPGSFSGYISHNAPFSMETYLDYLRTMDLKQTCGDSRIRTIQEPVLLLHNLDDNRIPAEQVVDWYKKALEEGKSDLVRLHLTKMGGGFDLDEPTLKGHFLPIGADSFARYMQTIVDFVLLGPNEVPKASEWVLTKAQMKLDSARMAPATESARARIFLSVAYRYFKNKEKAARSRWSAVIEGLSNVFMGRGYGDFYDQYLSDNKFAGEIDESDWKEITPLLFGLEYIFSGKASYHSGSYLSSVLKKDPKVSQILENGIREMLPTYLSFLREIGVLNEEVDVASLSRNKELQSLYLKYLSSPTDLISENVCRVTGISMRAYEFLLLSLFRGNMDKIRDFMGPTNYAATQQSLQKDLESLRQDFNKLLKIRRER